MEVTSQNRVHTGGKKQVHPAVCVKMIFCISKYNPLWLIISKNLLGQMIFWLTVDNLGWGVKGRPKKEFFVRNNGSRSIICANNLLDRLGNISALICNSFIPISIIFGVKRLNFRAKSGPKITILVHNGGSRSIICANNLLNWLGRCFSYLCFNLS